MQLAMTSGVFAGMVPEDILHNDEAKLFFAKIVSYQQDGENPYIEVYPVKKIKGDVNLGVNQIYYKAIPVGEIDIKKNNVYLVASLGEGTETYMFKATSYDTETLKIEGNKSELWQRFEDYLNEGRYENAEAERLERAGLPVTATELDELPPLVVSDYNVYKVIIGVVCSVIVIAVIVFVIRIRNSR